MPVDYNSILSGANFHNSSWDAFIFLFWIITALIYSFHAGRRRIITVLVAVYMSELLVTQAPFLSDASGSQTVLGAFPLRLAAFLILFAFLFLVLSRHVFHNPGEHRGSRSFVFSLVFSFLQVGFLISVVLSFLPVETKSTFAPLVHTIFLSNFTSFIWLLLPIAYLVLMGRRVGHNQE